MIIRDKKTGKFKNVPNKRLKNVFYNYLSDLSFSERLLFLFSPNDASGKIATNLTEKANNIKLQ